MRAYEFLNEDTTSGSIATVAQPMGSVIKRSPIYPNHAKYKNSVLKHKKHRTNYAF